MDRPRPPQVVTIVESDSEVVPVKTEKPQRSKVRNSCLFISAGSITPLRRIPHGVATATADGGKNDVPDLAEALWRKSFLPSMCGTFYATDRPFEDFKKNRVRLREILQTVVCDVHPNFYCEVRFGDAFMVMV
jgi:hypothetical protein